MSRIRFIAGSGRSGTTWIQDSLAAANGLRPVFEPLNPFVSGIGRLYAHRSLRPSEIHGDLQTFLTDVFAGRRERLWTQFRRQRNWLLPGRGLLDSTANATRFGRRWIRFLREAPGLASMARAGEPLVKCIFANLMLDWLRKHCNCQILFVVRHPGAVVESELRSGWNPKDALECFRSDDVLHALTEDRYRSLLSRQLSPVGALAAKWVVENQPVIEGQVSGADAIVSYEMLAESDTGSWAKVLDALQLEHAPDARHLAQPSQQSAPRGTSDRKDARIGTTWRNGLTGEQAAEIQEVLDSVRFATYSMDGTNPMRRVDHATLCGVGTAS